MSLQKRKERPKGLIKILRVLICSLFLFALSCSGGGTSSTTSSAGSSGTGTGWKITVTTFKNSASSSGSEAVGVNVIVKDSSGAAAPKGTQICVTASRGGFLVGTSVVQSKCDSTITDNGQVTETYKPAIVLITTTVDPATGTATNTTVQVPISPGPDTISASSMGVFGSTIIEVLP